MIVVFGEESTRKTSINAQELQAILEAAKLFGCRVYMIPPDFSICETAENALAYVPTFDSPTLGIWVGYIPTIERYTAIYNAALNKGVKLINTPQQHQMAMEFDHFYPLIQDITPKSVIVDSLEGLSDITDLLQFPVFVKGAVKSNKEQGWNSVVAKDIGELEELGRNILALSYRSRGKLIIRELAPLRRIDVSPNGFPINREYRVFVYKEDIVTYSFYWDEYTDSEPLSVLDKRNMLRLALDTAQRVEVPFLAIDIGQLETGDWTVIEIGDAQFCGLSQVPVLELWSKIKDFS